MRRVARLISFAGIVFLTWSLLAGCSTDGILGKGNDHAGDDTATTSAKTFSFATDLHPILVKNCAGCHATSVAPLFAVDDAVASERTLISAQKVDLADATKSRIYLRLANDKHNCWGNCEANAAEVLVHLEGWAKASASEVQKTAVAAGLPPKVITNALTLADLKIDTQPNPNDDGTFYFEAEDGRVDLRPTTTMVRTTRTPGASRRAFVETPVGVQVRDDNRGWVDLPIDAPRPGIYTLWARVAGGNARVQLLRPDDATQDSAVLQWNFAAPPTGEPTSTWRWDFLRDPGNGAVANQFRLRAGRYLLRIFSGNPGSRIDVVAFTPNPFFAPTDELKTTPPNFEVLRYDVAEQTGIAGLVFTVQARTKTETSQVFTNPSFWLPEDGGVYVRGIRPLINGELTPQNATWAEISEGVVGPGGAIPVSPMIVIVPAGATISWGFDLVEPAVLDEQPNP
jgi:hypothetical protein